MSATVRLGLLIVGGCAITNLAFMVPIWDTWTRLIVVLSMLGLVGLLVSWKEPSVWRRPAAGALMLAALSGVMMAIAAWLLTALAPVRVQMTSLIPMTGGHSGASLAATLPLAVLGEELFWRAAVQRLAIDRYGTVAGVLVACAAYGLAHVASGTWLLPLAACGAGLVWAILYVTLRTLGAPIASHFILDALVLCAVIR